MRFNQAREEVVRRASTDVEGFFAMVFGRRGVVPGGSSGHGVWESGRRVQRLKRRHPGVRVLFSRKRGSGVGESLRPR